MRRLAATFGFLDVTSATIDSGMFGMPGPAAKTVEELRRNLRELPYQRWLHLPGYRHSGGANITFLDGHVEHREWEFKEREPISQFGHRPVNATDLTDMRWLVQRGAAWQKYLP